MGGSVSKERWLGLVGIGEDGFEGLTPAARRLIAQAAFVVGGKRHLALAGSLKAETMIWPSPIENALDAIEAPSRPLRMRARQRRSVLLRRRRHADAAFRGRRDDLDPGALRLCARCGAARLEPAGLRLAVRFTGGRSKRSFRICSRGARILALSWDRRHAGQAGGAFDCARHGAIEAHDLRGDGRPSASAFARRRRKALRSTTSPP